jgi:hypothetical protein
MDLNKPDDDGGVQGPARVGRRGLMAAGAGTLIVGLASAADAGAVTSARGGGQVGDLGAATGIELVGEIYQDGDDLVAHGYFTMVAGFTREQVFFPDVDRNEATARFTFHATAQLTAIHRRETVFVTSATGGLDVYLRDAPGGGFDNPASFVQGLKIASDEIKLQNVLNVTDPNLGAIDLTGDFQRTAVQTFVLHGRTCRLGHKGLQSRLVAAGRGVRTDPLTPKSIVTVGGNISNPR